jgi:hexosaminidase
MLMMLRIVYFLGAFFLALQTMAQQTMESPAIIPLPANMQLTGGQYELPASITISCLNAAAGTDLVIKQLTGKLQLAGNRECTISAAQTADIQLIVNKKKDAALGREGYQLKVKNSGIIITANEAAGLFYGLQTLWQLFPPDFEKKKPVGSKQFGIPQVMITDQPRFGWRGLMLDVTRHFFTKQQVKDFIDHMVLYKFNLLHLHLTDDQGWRIEIKSLPRLTEVGAFRAARTGRWGDFKPQQPGEASDYGGFYTQDDIRELLAYAKERFVTIMPEIDIPGHSLALIAAYPELSCTPGNYQVSVGNRFMIWPGNGTFYGTIDNNLCVANEQVYTLLDKVFTEIAALFPFEYIHMGGDETYKGFWEKSDAITALMKKEGLKDMHEVQSYFVRRVAKIIKSKGKKMIGWDEILEGGLAPDAAVMSWRGEKGGIEAAKLKHPVVMTPSTYAYVDLYQGDPLAEPPTYSMVRLNKAYAFNPVPAGVDSGYILGAQANLWSERLHTVRHMEYMLWPRGWAIAEAAWSRPANKNFANFVSRVEQHFLRFDAADINYSRSVYDPIVDVQKISDSTIQVKLSTELSDLNIHYSFDEFYPDRFYPVYTSALVFPEGASSLKISTYRGDKKMGKDINLPLNELRKRAK